jgi:hypothetical protein
MTETINHVIVHQSALNGQLSAGKGEQKTGLPLLTDS